MKNTVTLDRCSFADSSVLTRASYNREAQVLTLWFNSGSVYTYKGVNQGVFLALCDADSAGSHFARYIRPFYKGTRIQ
jgi:hypothetical protein